LTQSMKVLWRNGGRGARWLSGPLGGVIFAKMKMWVWPEAPVGETGVRGDGVCPFPAGRRGRAVRVL